MMDGRDHADDCVATATALADLEAAIKQAEQDGSGKITMSASIPAARAIWYALQMLHPRSPVISLLPGQIAGEVWLSLIAGDMEKQLETLRELVDTLGPVAMLLNRGRGGSTWRRP
jgi:hypothetical protein